MKINHFRGECAFLSNFWEVPLTYNGLTYGSNEAAFQVQKCMTEEDKVRFPQLRPDREAVKAGIMEEIVRATSS